MSGTYVRRLEPNTSARDGVYTIVTLPERSMRMPSPLTPAVCVAKRR